MKMKPLYDYKEDIKMLSVILEFENGKKATIHSTSEDLKVFIEALHKAEPLKDVHVK